MKSILSAVWLAAASVSLFAQEFEVASIKVIDPKKLQEDCRDISWGRQGGPGTDNPERVAYRCQPLQLLVLEAFGFQESETFRMPNLSSRIEWDHFVNVSAIVPPKTSVSEYKTLLRDLLARRYHLKSHEETRERDVYELVVPPNGLRLKAHVENPDRPRAAEDGLIALTPVPGQVLATGRRDHWRIVGSDVTIQPLAERIEGIVQAPVLDRTGLDGKFDFQLDFDPGYGPASETGVSYPVLSSALRDQLGLSLRKTRGAVKVVIIDSIDPRPSEN